MENYLLELLLNEEFEEVVHQTRQAWANREMRYVDFLAVCHLLPAEWREQLALL